MSNSAPRAQAVNVHAGGQRISTYENVCRLADHLQMSNAAGLVWTTSIVLIMLELSYDMMYASHALIYGSESNQRSHLCFQLCDTCCIIGTSISLFLTSLILVLLGLPLLQMQLVLQTGDTLPEMRHFILQCGGGGSNLRTYQQCCTPRFVYILAHTSSSYTSPFCHCRCRHAWLSIAMLGLAYMGQNLKLSSS